MKVSLYLLAFVKFLNVDVCLYHSGVERYSGARSAKLYISKAHGLHRDV